MRFKNIYTLPVLQAAFREYQALRKDLHYKEGFLLLTCLQIYLDYGLRSSELTQTEAQELLLIQFEHLLEIRRGWGITIPIEPNLRLTEKDLTIEYTAPCSPLAKLIFAYGISCDSRLIMPPEKQTRTVSDKRFEFELRTQKYFAYALYKICHASLNKLGRFFNKDKGTIKKWVEEMEAQEEGEIEALLSETRTSKRLPDIDFYRLFRKNRRSIASLEGDGEPEEE